VVVAVATQGSRQLTARVPTVEVWWSAACGVAARGGCPAVWRRPSWSGWGAGFAPYATGVCFTTCCDGGVPWLRRLSEHTEYLYLAELKVEDVFFALVASAMRLASGCRLPSGLCVWLSP